MGPLKLFQRGLNGGVAIRIEEHDRPSLDTVLLVIEAVVRPFHRILHDVRSRDVGALELRARDQALVRLERSTNVVRTLEFRGGSGSELPVKLPELLSGQRGRVPEVGGRVRPARVNRVLREKQPVVVSWGELSILGDAGDAGLCDDTEREFVGLSCAVVDHPAEALHLDAHGNVRLLWGTTEI